MADLRPDRSPVRFDPTSGEPARTVTLPDPDAVDTRVLPVRFDGRPYPLVLRVIAIALAVALGLMGAVLIGGWMLGRSLDGLNPFHTTTVDRSSPPVLKSLTDLKTFHAASGYYEVVIDQEKDVSNLPSFLAGERVLFVAAGSVDATVDFSSLTPDKVRTNAARTSVAVTLPAVQLAPPRLDLQRSYVADHQRGLKERLEDALGSQPSAEDTQALYRLAEQRLAQAGARTQDLQTRAEASTRAMLTALFTSAGYTDVTVTFVAEP
jgi:hypothetical protein